MPMSVGVGARRRPGHGKGLALAHSVATARLEARAMVDEPLLAIRTFSVLGEPEPERERERVTQLQREIGEHFSVNLAFSPVGERPPKAQFVGYRGGRLQFGSLSFTPH